MNIRLLISGIFFTAAALLTTCCFAQDAGERTWSDSTGKFTIVGSLVEVKGADVFIKTTDGKTMKIPIARLSKSDQDYLSPSSSPFEEIATQLCLLNLHRLHRLRLAPTKLLATLPPMTGQVIYRSIGTEYLRWMQALALLGLLRFHRRMSYPKNSNACPLLRKCTSSRIFTNLH